MSQNDVKIECPSKTYQNDDISLPSLEQKSDHSVPLSHDFAPEPSSHEGLIKDVLVSTGVPIF